MSIFGDRVRRERERLGIDQANLASRVGVSQQTVSRWEAGDSRPRLAVAEKLAGVFGVDAEEFAELSGHGARNARGGSVEPPVRPLLTELPFDSLNPDTFEDLVADVAQALHPDLEVVRFGGPGHKQHGLDVRVTRGNVVAVNYQVKRVRQFGPALVDQAFSDTTIDAEQNVIVLARQFASPAALESARKHNNWQIWDGNRLSRKIRLLPPEQSMRILDTYFGQYTEDFLGISGYRPFQTTDEFFPPRTPGSILSQEWSLVGRTDVVESVMNFALESDQRVGLLVGRGGIGKSRLLREIAIRVSRTEADVRFLKSRAEVGSRDLALLPRGGKLLVVIDDAHDRDELVTTVGALLRLGADVKVLLALRPYALSGIQNDLVQLRMLPQEVPSFILKDLSLTEAARLAREALGDAGDDEIALLLGNLTKDFPFLTVVAGVLIQRGELEVSTLRSGSAFRSIVLGRFADIIIAGPESADEDLRRAVVDAISVLQPFHSSDVTFQTSLSRIVDMPYDRAFRHIRELEDSGVIMRRGDALRIVPDLLGDALLARTSFDEASMTSTGFVERVWRDVEPPAKLNVLVNASRVDWQLRQDAAANRQITSVLWSEVLESVGAMGAPAKIGMLRLLRKISVFEPEQTLTIIRMMLENSIDDEDADSTLSEYGSTPLNVLHEIPPVLRGVAYDLKYVQDAAQILWGLARRDDRDIARNPNHPIRALQEIASIVPGKSLQYNRKIVDLAEQWLREDVSASLYSPFDVLAPILSTQGSIDSSDGHSITISQFFIAADSVRPLRDRVIGLALSEIVTGDLLRESRAVRLLGGALRYPAAIRGPDGIRASASEWTPIFCVTLEKIKREVALLPVRPVIAVAIRQELLWHLEYSPSETRESAREVIQALGDELQVRLACALHDGWCHLFRGRTGDFAIDDLEKQRQMDELSREVLRIYGDDQLLQQVMENIAENRVVFPNREGSAGQFVWTLVKHRATFGEALCNDVIDNPSNPCKYLAPVALAAVGEANPDALVVLARRMVDTRQEFLRVTVAQALGLNRAARTSMAEGEFELLNELAKDPSVQVRKLVAQAARRFAHLGQPEGRQLLLTIPFSDSAEVAEEVLGEIGEGASTRWTDFSVTQREATFGQLLLCGEIGGYWTWKFLAERCVDDLSSVARLLRARVELWETTDTLEPIPSFTNQQLNATGSPDLENVLRETLDWLEEGIDKWQRRDAGGRLFAMIAGAFENVVAVVIEEWAAVSSPTRLAVVRAVLRHMPSDAVFSNVEFITGALRSSERDGMESYQRLVSELDMAVLSGVYKSGFGGPASRDVSIRDSSLRVADMLQKGSPEERFYRSLATAAAARMEWSIGKDAVEIDGRDWGQ